MIWKPSPSRRRPSSRPPPAPTPPGASQQPRERRAPNPAGGAPGGQEPAPKPSGFARKAEREAGPAPATSPLGARRGLGLVGLLVGPRPTATFTGGLPRAPSPKTDPKLTPKPTPKVPVTWSKPRSHRIGRAEKPGGGFCSLLSRPGGSVGPPHCVGVPGEEGAAPGPAQSPPSPPQPAASQAMAPPPPAPPKAPALKPNPGLGGERLGAALPRGGGRFSGCPPP